MLRLHSRGDVVPVSHPLRVVQAELLLVVYMCVRFRVHAKERTEQQAQIKTRSHEEVEPAVLESGASTEH